MNIKDSVVFISGANRGLGLAYARGFLAAGARKVYAGARNLDTLDIPGVHPVKLDITNADDVRAAAEAAPDTTILVNNAGIMFFGGFLGDDNVANTRQLLETNFFGTLTMARAFAPILTKNGGGAMINVLSAASWFNRPVIGSYCASKAAAWSLTNGIRNEMRESKTLVVAVHCAYLDTDMAKSVETFKTKPEEVVRQTFEAMENGREEVLVDDITKEAKAGLSAEDASYFKVWGG